jgi:hypothetical protein
LAKAKTVKIKAEALEHHGISTEDGDNNDECRKLEARIERTRAQIAKEKAKLGKDEPDDLDDDDELEPKKPVQRLARRSLKRRREL